MHRITSIVLLLSFLFSNIGFYFLVLVLESTNREEMQANLNRNETIEIIRIPRSEAKDIIYSSDSTEILLNGEMYDVMDTSDDDDKESDDIILKCVHDKKETKLIAELDKQVKYNSNSNPSSEKKQNDFSKNPVKDLFFPKTTIFVPYSIGFEFPSIMCHLTSYISSPIPPPPPDVAVA